MQEFIHGESNWHKFTWWFHKIIVTDIFIMQTYKELIYLQQVIHFLMCMQYSHHDNLEAFEWHSLGTNYGSSSTNSWHPSNQNVLMLKYILLIFTVESVLWYTDIIQILSGLTGQKHIIWFVKNKLAKFPTVYL